jgi:DNA polymerase V
MISILSPMQPVASADAPCMAQLLNNQVKAGFPSPAEDLGGERIDLKDILMTHPQATYFMRASGFSMVELGISDQDILVVNRAKRPRHKHIVVASVDGEFTVKQLYKKLGRTKLQAANPTYPDIIPKDGETIQVWGVVTGCIKLFPA